MNILSTDTSAVKGIFGNFRIPGRGTHKGQNGRILIVGGSSLFHAASIWAAEVASHFADIVHYASTAENNGIMQSLKTQFLNGIVVPREAIDAYVREDDAILIGPGMIRSDKQASGYKKTYGSLSEVNTIRDEGLYTAALTHYLISHFPEKQFVFDAGSLQMMNPEWLGELKKPALITPHQKEFEGLFGIPVQAMTKEEKISAVSAMAKKYRTTIMLKAVYDIVSDGTETACIEGGNQGLSKGGTGDTLAGLAVSFAAQHTVFQSAVFSSLLLKRTADDLAKEKGYWYNISDIIDQIPKTLNRIISQ